jgi:two-component system nitrate/nitrite response regulator NarL
MNSVSATRLASKSNSAGRSRAADRRDRRRAGRGPAGGADEPPQATGAADGGPDAQERTTPDGTRGRRAATTQRISVVIADGHQMFRAAFEQALRSWPEFEVVATVGDSSLFEVVADKKPEVLLVDPSTIGVSGDELLAGMQARCRVVVVREGPRSAEVYRFLTSGAAAFLAKDCSEQEVRNAVLAAARAESRIGASVQPLLARELRLRRGGSSEFLTDREIEILKLMAAGLSAPDIARELGIRLPTVKTHQANIYGRLGVHDGKAAVWRGMRLKVIE